MSYRTAVAVAFIAAAFSIAITAALMVSVFRPQANLLDDQKLRDLKDQLWRNPEEESLKSQIREVDRVTRLAYLRHMHFLHTGAYLLLGGMILFIVAAKSAAKLSGPIMPPAKVLETGAWRDSLPSIWSIGTGAVSLATIGVTLALAFPKAPLPRPNAGGAGTTEAQTPDEPISNEPTTLNCPAFRGTDGLAAAGGQFPIHWDVPTQKGLLWRAPVVLPGRNSPIVWGDKVFLAGASKDQRLVWCHDANTGAILWKQAIGQGSTALDINEETTYAAPSMATDGQSVFAFFASGDLACLDFAGKSVWTKNLGEPATQYGPASSLLVVADKLIVQLDQGLDPTDNQSSLLAFNTATGEQLWQAKRASQSSWGSPILAPTPSGAQILCSGNPIAAAYDPATGEELWHSKCLQEDVVPSPAFSVVNERGLAFFACQHALVALATDAKGNISKEHWLWANEDADADIVSPLAHANRLWVVTQRDALCCLDASTGKFLYQQDLSAKTHASPILAGGRIYLLDDKGIMHIFSAGDKYQEIAASPVGEEVQASPAFANGRIFIRGLTTLYCITGGGKIQ